MSKLKIPRVIVAQTTPMNEHGEIDVDDQLNHDRFLFKHGVGVLRGGTTAQTTVMDWREHLQSIARTAKEARDDGYLLAGIGGNNTHEVIAAAKQVVMKGVNGLLLVDSYYNGPSSDELACEHHLPVIMTAAELNPDIDIFLYPIPGRTGCQIQPAHIAWLSEKVKKWFPNVEIAIKDATGKEANWIETRHLMPQVRLFSGDDDKTAQMIIDKKIRAWGVISVMAAFFPELVKEMVTAYAEGRIQDGDRLADKIAKLFKLVTVKSKVIVNLESRGQQIPVEAVYKNPHAANLIAVLVGMTDHLHLRQPLGLMNRDGVMQVLNVLRDMHTVYPGIFTPIEEHFTVDMKHRLYDWADAMGDKLHNGR